MTGILLRFRPLLLFTVGTQPNQETMLKNRPTQLWSRRRCRCCVGLRPTLDAEVSLSVGPARRRPLTSALCRSNVGVRRRRPLTSDEVSEQCRPRPTSAADVGVVSALADVGRQRRRCVGAVSASADVGRRRRSSVGPVSDLGRRRRPTLLLP